MALPVALAAFSPLLAWRDPIYIAACFGGIVAMALLLVQPLLAGNQVPGLSRLRARHLHRWIGGALVIVVALHVGGLYLTSAPDVVDALLFRSPTSFSPWGVVAMGALILVALLAAAPRKLRLRPRLWRLLHVALATVVVAGTIVHAVLIEGTMAPWSKVALSAGLAGALALYALSTLRQPG